MPLIGDVRNGSGRLDALGSELRSQVEVVDIGQRADAD